MLIKQLNRWGRMARNKKPSTGDGGGCDDSQLIKKVNDVASEAIFELLKKADKSYVHEELEKKADIALLADITAFTPSLLKNKYGIQGNETDSVDNLQNALNDIAIKYKRVVFPPNTTYFVNKTLHVPSDIHIDFNGAIVYVLNDMDDDAITLEGGNITLENLTMIEKDHRELYVSDGDGISVKVSANVDNIKLINIKTEGFLHGISLSVPNGFMTSNIKIKDCTTNYSSFSGLNLSNVKNGFIKRHTAMFNKKDGMKTTRNVTNLDIDGIIASYNGVNGAYADGIDLYAGGNKVIVRGAICEHNTGVGIHLLSGELNDPAFPEFFDSFTTDILISDSFCNYNERTGLDVVVKNSVSSTTPHPSNVNITNCMFIGNNYGAIITARNVTLANCTSKLNNHNGFEISDSRYIDLIGCKAIANSQLSPGTKVGIRISKSKHIKVIGGFINGSDGHTLQNTDEVGLEKYHLHGIHIDAASSDDILIDNPTIVNYTGGRSVRVANSKNNPNSRVVIHLGDIGADRTDSYNAFLGSTFYKNNRKYNKNTPTDSVLWDIVPIERSGITAFTTDQGQAQYNIPHGLGNKPTRFYAILILEANGKVVKRIEADDIFLYVSLNEAPAVGTSFSIHWFASY